MRLLLDSCADGKFAPSKIAPYEYTKKYPGRRRNGWAESYSAAKNHTQNLGSAIAIARETDVQEGINDNCQQKRIRCQKANASPQPRAPRVGPKSAKRGEEETRCGTNCAKGKEECKTCKRESVRHDSPKMRPRDRSTDCETPLATALNQGTSMFPRRQSGGSYSSIPRPAQSCWH